MSVTTKEKWYQVADKTLPSRKREQPSHLAGVVKSHYAPEENPIEAIWFQLKSLLRRFYRFGKNFKIINLLFQFFAKYNLFNFPDLKRFDAFSQLI